MTSNSVDALVDPAGAGQEGLGGRLSRLAALFPSRVALVDEHRVWTYADTELAANQFARALASRGVRPSSWVGIMLKNRGEFMLSALAAWKLGAVPVPFSWRLPPQELEATLALASLELLIVEADAERAPRALPLSELLAEARSLDVAPPPDRINRPWKIAMSGGSTGRPKLIIADTTAPTAPSVRAIYRMRPSGTALIASPLYFNGPFVYATLQLIAGGTVVIRPRFDPVDFLRSLNDHKVNWTFAVPTMLNRVMALEPALRAAVDLTPLEVVMHSAAPMPTWLKRQVIDWLGPERVLEFYGATEVRATTIWGDEWLTRPGSVGRPLPGHRIEIRDDAGVKLPAGSIGEIWIAPPGGPAYSYRGAEARIEDGYCSVGDLGWLDEDGYLYIADRRADLIITGGINVYPAEVEAAILEHPSVVDACVIGLPDREYGQIVHAIVELKSNALPDSPLLLAHCRQRLATFKLPRSFEFIPALPREVTGKLRRSALRDDRVMNRDQAS